MDGQERAPFAGYAAILGSFGGALALTAALERRLDRARAAPTILDLVLLSAASFKVARAVSRERVGSVVREPFVETDESADGRVLAERPAGEGLRRAIGELVTCTRCTGTWAAAGLLAAQTAAPRFGRLLTWALAAGGANDFLHAGFVVLCDRSTGFRSPPLLSPTPR